MGQVKGQLKARGSEGKEEGHMEGGRFRSTNRVEGKRDSLYLCVRRLNQQASMASRDEDPRLCSPDSEPLLDLSWRREGES